MSNNVILNSYVYHFLLHCRRISEVQRLLDPETFDGWQQWIEGLEFKNGLDNSVSVYWTHPQPGNIALGTDGLIWFSHGTKESRVNQNQVILEKHVRQAAMESGLSIHAENTIESIMEGRFHSHYQEEELLFDTWAKSVDPKKIDIFLMNESVTAPEMRFITSALGDLTKKTLLDIGCGLGEASVYFAVKGAEVTAVDVSRDMLTEVSLLAESYKTRVRTHRASIDHLHFPKGEKFDVIYAGNVFHHVNISTALDEIISLMTDESILVCWEPVAYNPIINIYRKIATHVRSDDEHPLTLSDIDQFRQYFSSVEVEWFWLTTLVIFILMFFWQRRNPNNERFWKAVVVEGEKWAWLYKPLAAIDHWLISVFPFLGPLCWNVVIIAKQPKEKNNNIR
ncbi:MAG TPA: class I SAM-dependent methyltransferase [Anaerolineaceae bacterium]|nr:class I SAM-dependent methyltransferase [Anaerolineaceae bacterium]HPN52501.1 class I SAM-dependent methyltransferase [Anaerolineaceae bacterium]